MPIRSTTTFRVELDDETAVRLTKLAAFVGGDPACIIASMMHDILLEDEMEHANVRPHPAAGLN